MRIDLSNPTAGIVDPSSGIAVTKMDCGLGQTDLNKASVAELIFALRIARPIAERVVDMRPYLAPTDLSVVEGIGRGVPLQTILASKVACATPTSLPPAVTPEVCTAGDDRLDVQRATVNDIVRRLQLGSPVAQRLVASRPYASIAHLTRVEGIGPGRINAIRANGCLTPAPIDTSGSAYRWASAGGGGIAKVGGFQLAVPPGTVTSTGAWLSVQPLDPVPGPTADFKIYGSWSGPVALTIPAQPASDAPAGWSNVVVHKAMTPDLIWGPNAMFDSGGSLTIATSTLSPYSATRLGGNPYLDECLELKAATDGSRQVDPQSARSLMQCGFENYLNSMPSEPPAVDLNGCAKTDQLETVGYLPQWAVTCAQHDSGSKATWTIGNNTLDATWGLVGTGAVATVNIDPSISTVSPWDRSGEGLVPSMLSIFDSFRGEKRFYPGTKINPTLSEGKAGSVRFDTDDARTFVLYAINTAIGSFADSLNVAGSVVKDCAESGVVNGLNGWAKSVLDCLKFALKTGVVAGVQALLKASEYAMFLVTATIDLIASSVQASAFEGGARIDLLHRLPKPTVDGSGRPLLGACVAADGPGWRIDDACQAAAYSQPGVGGGDSGVGSSSLPNGWIVRNNAGNAWLYTPGDKLFHPIATGGDYLCLSYHYWVDWNSHTLPTLSATLGKNTTCPAGDIPLQRDAYLTPTTMLTSVKLLRESSGRVWYVTSGKRWEVPSGAEFLCWVDPPAAYTGEVHVWDQVTADEVARFPEWGSGTAFSNCGNGF